MLLSSSEVISRIAARPPASPPPQGPRTDRGQVRLHRPGLPAIRLVDRSERLRGRHLDPRSRRGQQTGSRRSSRVPRRASWSPRRRSWRALAAAISKTATRRRSWNPVPRIPAPSASLQTPSTRTTPYDSGGSQNGFSPGPVRERRPRRGSRGTRLQGSPRPPPLTDRTERFRSRSPDSRGTEMFDLVAPLHRQSGPPLHKYERWSLRLSRVEVGGRVPRGNPLFPDHQGLPYGRSKAVDLSS